MGNNNKVEIVDDKLEALQRALGMLSTAKEFTLTVFNGDEINATILCNKWREVDVIKKSIATQSYMLEDLTSESLLIKIEKMNIAENEKCHICGYSAEYICSVCELPYCENCEADSEINVNIESPCCKECESIY